MAAKTKLYRLLAKLAAIAAFISTSLESEWSASTFIPEKLNKKIIKDELASNLSIR